MVVFVAPCARPDAGGYDEGCVAPEVGAGGRPIGNVITGGVIAIVPPSVALPLIPDCPDPAFVLVVFVGALPVGVVGDPAPGADGDPAGHP